MSTSTRLHRVLRILLLTGMLATFTGCAYFNTYYNARYFYKQGLKKEENKPGAGKRDFDNSLKKAVIVARDYPESRWVDDAFFLIAMDYYWMQTYDKAAVQFEGFLEHFPLSPYREEARYHYGLSLIELGRYGDGRLILAEMFSSRRFGRKARFAWAEAFRTEDDLEGARRAFNEFLEAHPRGDLASAAQLHLAEIELIGGDTAAAIDIYDKYLKRAETSRENYERQVTLAELYYLGGEYRQAIRTLNKVRGKYPEVDQHADLMTGKIVLAQGDTSKATRILAEVPRGAYRGEAFYILATVYEEQESYDEALAYLDTVTSRERVSDYAALAERKKALLESRVLHTSDTTDTLTIDPAEEQFMLAETYLLSFDDPARTLEEYLKVVSEYPDSKYAPKALYGIAWLKRYRLKDDSWKDDLQVLIERYPYSQAAGEAAEILKEEFGMDITLPEKPSEEPVEMNESRAQKPELQEESNQSTEEQDSDIPDVEIKDETPEGEEPDSGSQDQEHPDERNETPSQLL